MARSAASPLALRFFGGLAYTVALLMVVSLVFVLISDPDAFTEQGVTAEMDAAMAFFGLLWGALLAAPMWVARWLGVRPRVGQLFGVFAVLSAVIQVALVVAAVVGPEVREVRSWASTRHWSTQELKLLGVPGALLGRLGAALADPTEGALRELTAAVHAHLEGHEWTGYQDRMALFRWAFLTPEGKGAFAEWAAR